MLFTAAAVILPTLWLYLEHRFDAEQWFFGVVFASFCFTSLLSSPLFGFWVDYTRKTKPALLFANLFEIGGKLVLCDSFVLVYLHSTNLGALLGGCVPHLNYNLVM